jgi:hypothetical protein
LRGELQPVLDFPCLGAGVQSSIVSVRQEKLA